MGLSLPNVVSAAEAIGDFLFGGGTVTLGPVAFTGLALPEKINFGGRQSHAVHKLVGGARVIDTMGPDDADIRWSGYFDGGAAAYCAQALDQLRVAGAAVQLTWPGFARTVIITEFGCSYERGGWLLPYHVCCLVLPVRQAFSGDTLLGSLGTDIGEAIGIPDLMPTVGSLLGGAQAALQAVQTALPLTGMLTAGSPAFVSVSSAIASAQYALTGAIGTAESGMGSLLAGAGVTGTPLGTPDSVSATAVLQSALSGAQNLAGLTGMNAYLLRAAANLNRAGA